MATTKEYLDYVLDLLRECKGITYKKMMGEYILYKDEVIIGGIYDNRFLVKKNKALEKYKFKEEIPYPGAKPMLLVDIEDVNKLKKLVSELAK